MDQKTYDIIYSIGADCGCALYMQRHGLRKYASPFDWLTKATFETRLKLIVNGFKGFLDKDSIKPLIQENHPTNLHYALYQDINLGFYFYHDFDTNLEFDKALLDVQNKYQRRIKRFYKKIEKSERVLLVWFSRYSTIDDSITKELCEKVITKFGKKIDFLLIENEENKNLGEIEKVEISPNIIKYKLNTSKLNGTDNETLGNMIDCDRIFSEYELYTPSTNIIINKTRIYGIKLLCALIPIKKQRKKFRSFLLEKSEI